MVTQDLITILYWWLILFGTGLIFLPLAFRVFGGFWDKGYAFSKILGLLLISYTVWLLGSLKILPFFRETIFLVILGWIAFNLCLTKGLKGIKGIKKIVAEELLFFACLTFWSLVRGFQPDIQGLEKFMDFGFVNSILRSKFFPPADMWFAGGTINYYYFGHFVTALLTKLSGGNSAITYNLQIATLFALAFTATFSLTSNLIHGTRNTCPQMLRIKRCRRAKHGTRKIIFGGLIAALLLTLGANLHPAYYNLKMKVFKKPYCNGSLNYWYPDATRYIGYCPEVEDKTIHEFPSYSFVVSDLHGHVSDIPFVLLFLALVLGMIRDNKGASGKIRKKWKKLPSLLIPLTLSVMYMTNSWDLPIYFMVLGLVLLWLNYQKFGLTSRTILRTMLHVTCYMLLAILFILPFQLNFDPLVKGIDFVHAHSLPHQLLILWGAPWFFGITFLIFLFKDKIKSFIQRESLVKQFSHLLGVKIKLSKLPKKYHISHITYHISHTDIFVLILLAVSTLLVLIPEVIYVKDIYISSYHRANTMFKLTYQAFMMYSIAIGYIIIRVLSSLKRGFLKFSLFTIHCSLFTALILYPFFSIKSYYGLKNYQGLYGLNFLKRLYPDNYQAVLWLNKSVSGQPVILEAAGDSYTDYNQISMTTGLPTVEGWLVHEWLWRGGFDEPGERASEVQQIYEGDINTAKNLLKKYNVQYVIVSNLEREKYPNINEAKFNSFGKSVFSSEKTRIYKIN